MTVKIVDGEIVPLTAEETAEREAIQAPSRLDMWRDTATLSRRQFCLACLQAGLLTPDDAVIAATGGWPASFDAALAGLSTIEVAAAKVEWAAVSVIRRSAPLLSVVQASTEGAVTDETLDAMFGWQG